MIENSVLFDFFSLKASFLSSTVPCFPTVIQYNYCQLFIIAVLFDNPHQLVIELVGTFFLYSTNHHTSKEVQRIRHRRAQASIGRRTQTLVGRETQASIQAEAEAVAELNFKLLWKEEAY